MRIPFVVFLCTAVVVIGGAVVRDRLEEGTAPTTGAPPAEGNGNGDGNRGSPRPSPTGVKPSPTGVRGSATGGVTERPSTGTVTATFRGTGGVERISCAAISTEFRVVANDGPIRWTAQARDREPGSTRPLPGSSPASVTVEPAAGWLDTGQSALVRLRGSFDGPDRRFWVYIEAPNRAGSTGATLGFRCP